MLPAVLNLSYSSLTLFSGFLPLSSSTALVNLLCSETTRQSPLKIKSTIKHVKLNIAAISQETGTV